MPSAPPPGLDALAPARVQTLLTTERYGRSLELEPETASTNDDARVAARRGVPPGHVIVADRQTRGRGSHGRTWASPGGTDLYISIVDRVVVQMAELPPLTLAVGLGVAETVEQIVGAGGHPVEVKWPNDIWLGGHKCAGILVEADSDGTTLSGLILGIGLNVNRTTFPPDLDHPATSMAMRSGRTFDRGHVLAVMLARVEARVREFEHAGPGPVIEALAGRLALRNEAVQCGDIRGVLTGIAIDGALRVKTPLGEQRCIAGRLRRA